MGGKGRVVVVGSGAAGSGAARTLSDAGWEVTIVEKDRVGGTCLWHGCIPKKALYTSGRAFRAASESEQFGIISGAPVADWPGVLAWKWHAQETYAGDQEAILAERGIALLRGDARFQSPTSIAVGDRLEEFEHAILATGSVPVTPPIPGVELADTSGDALGYSEPPASLVIVGAGFIAFELAGVFATFGSKVTVLVSSRPLKSFDPEVVAVAVRHLESLGVQFIYGSRASSLSRSDGAIRVGLSDAEEEARIEAERVIIAAGRRPALDDLDLGAAEIDTDERGRLHLDATLRTSNQRIWAAGDVAGGMMQTPVASMMGHTVAASIDSGTPVEPDTQAVPTTVFTVPQLASVGMTEEDASEAGIDYRVGRTEFEFLGSAIIDDDRDGIAKLLFAKADDRLIGAHIAAPNASDLIHAMAVGIATGATASDLRRVLGIHPGYSEALAWAAY